MSTLSSPFSSPMTINVQTYLVSDELFPLNDIYTRSCNHTYHPWCLLGHTISSRKCKVVNCDEVNANTLLSLNNFVLVMCCFG
jgi:hypothetical protein